MFNKILVAVDASEYTRQVIPTAIEVALKFSSSVFVLHVAEHDRGRAAVYSVEAPADATKLVADAVQAFRAAGITVKGEVHDVAAGHVAKNIIETASEEASDLIVMGSRGLSDVQGLLLGSVTHKVLQLSQACVLVARGPVRVKDSELEPVAVGARPSDERPVRGGSVDPSRRAIRHQPPASNHRLTGHMSRPELNNKIQAL